MKRFAFALVLSSLSLVATPNGAFALKTLNANVSCASTAKLQSRIDAVSSGVIATFNVSGVCVENIVVPEGKTITIKGVNLGAKIIPKDPSRPVLTTSGDTTILGMTIANDGGTADALVVAQRAGSLDIIGSDLSAPNVGVVVGVWRTSFGRILNSSINGGTDAAVEADDGSTLVVQGWPAFAPGPQGSKVTLSSANGAAVSCSQGASLTMQAKPVDLNNGAVEIKNSRVGVFADQCNANLVNKTNATTNFTISNIQADGYGIIAQAGGDTRIRNISISDNGGTGFAIYNGGFANIYGSVISGNSQGDISLGYGAIVSIPSSPAPTSIPDAFTGNTIHCFQSTDVPSAKLVVDGSAVTIPDGKTIDDLKTNNTGCVAVY